MTITIARCKDCFFKWRIWGGSVCGFALGFKQSFGTKKVCKLKRSLYGVKQSPRAWFEHFTKSIQNLGYMQSHVDHTMFYKHSGDNKIVILIVYVDDIILTDDNIMELEKLKGVLAKEFEIKDLGQLRYFLGI